MPNTARRVYFQAMATPRLQLNDAPAPEPAPEEAIESAPQQLFECDACGESFEGQPFGAGLLVWTRGDEVRYEEPPLCEDCAQQLSIGALLKWDSEEEEEG